MELEIKVEVLLFFVFIICVYLECSFCKIGRNICVYFRFVYNC